MNMDERRQKSKNQSLKSLFDTLGQNYGLNEKSEMKFNRKHGIQVKTESDFKMENYLNMNIEPEPEEDKNRGDWWQPIK